MKIQTKLKGEGKFSHPQKLENEREGEIGRERLRHAQNTWEKREKESGRKWKKERERKKERGRKRGIAIGKECVRERERERDSTAEQESEVVRLSPNKFISNVDYKSQEQWIKRLSVFVLVTMWHRKYISRMNYQSISSAYQM